MRAPLRTLFVLAALAALLAVPAVASAYAPDTDEFVTCIKSSENKIECVVGLLESDCINRVVADRARDAVMAAADRRADRGSGGGQGLGQGQGRGNDGHPDTARGKGTAYELKMNAKPGDGDIEVTIECGPKRIRGVLVATETVAPLEVTDDTGRDVTVALTAIAGILVALGAVEVLSTRRRARR